MATYTNIYQETRGGATSKSSRLKKNWRSIKKKILMEEKKRFKEELSFAIFQKMKARQFNEWKTNDGKPLPELENSTKEWKTINGYKHVKLMNTKNLRKNFTTESVSTKGNKINIFNPAKNKRGQEYAYYLNEPDIRNGKRWVNLDIPNECLPGGITRKKLLEGFKARLEKRYALELYKKR
tara:strand:- start:1413 stop:1955 length:543 start_codon:yes stop_codon:yes gene_type:complete